MDFCLSDLEFHFSVVIGIHQLFPKQFVSQKKKIKNPPIWTPLKQILKNISKMNNIIHSMVEAFASAPPLFLRIDSKIKD